MEKIDLPISITYRTSGVTPISDVAEGLLATEEILLEVIKLLPSLLPGIAVQQQSLSIRQISQESPLTELIAIGLITTFQDDLGVAVPELVLDLFGVAVPEKYDTLLTIVFLVLLLRGAEFAKIAAVRMYGDGSAKVLLRKLIKDTALSVNKTEEEVEAILNAKYASPKSVKRLVGAAQKFFVPSHKALNVPIYVDRLKIPTSVIADIPTVDELKESRDFDKYTHHTDIYLEIHAMDLDKTNTGWAAIVRDVSSRRLKMKVIEPLTSDVIWGKTSIVGDITVVSKLTSNGYVPSEIHLTSVKP